MAKITTRAGDGGYTGLLGADRVPKYDDRVEALGLIDEATSALGLARASASEERVKSTILDQQRKLYVLMAEVATPPENAEKLGYAITADDVARLEAIADELKREVEIGNKFIIPGDTIPGAALDLARTIVRRAERHVARMHHQGQIANQEALRYLNRLSDLLFVLARYVEHGTSEVTR